MNTNMNKYKSLDSQHIHETWNTLYEFLKYKAGMLDDHKRLKEYKEKFYKKINSKNINEWVTKPAAQIKIALDNDLI